MDFRLTDEEEAFRQEVRAFVRENISPAVQAGGQMAGTPEARAFVRKMGERGWLALTWPERYGGRGRSPYLLSVLNEELSYWEAPTVPVAAAVVAPTLMSAASDFLQDKLLPPIARGEIAFCLGYSEPEAGSDLFALQTRATRDGDDWVIEGHKRFTTHAHLVEYCLLIARSDPSLPKHRGLSLFVVDLKLPGITIRPLITMDGHHSTNEVFFDRVRVPREYLVGEPNRAAEYVALALEFERFLPFPVSKLQSRFEELVRLARNGPSALTSPRGHPTVSPLPIPEEGESRSDAPPEPAAPVAEEVSEGDSPSSGIGRGETVGCPLGDVRADGPSPTARHRLARLAIELEVARMLNLNLAHTAIRGLRPGVESAMNKLYATALDQRIAGAGVDLMGAYGQLREGSRRAPGTGAFAERLIGSVVSTIAGGSTEVLKNTIATRGLGLPR
jgi:alkylation response protein AidB-like acyl-CoA dehydrogenase